MLLNELSELCQSVENNGSCLDPYLDWNWFTVLQLHYEYQKASWIDKFCISNRMYSGISISVEMSNRCNVEHDGAETVNCIAEQQVLIHVSYMISNPACKGLANDT